MFCYIYKIIKNDAENDDMIYIGSSSNTYMRWALHKSRCNNPKGEYYNYKVYQYIRENGGIDEWKMVILDEFEIPLKKCIERNNYEKEYILKYDAVNKLNVILTGRTIKEYHNEYRENNKEKIKEYYIKNIDKIKENKKEKIKCSNCNALIARSNIAKHKQNKKCTNFNISLN